MHFIWRTIDRVRKSSYKGHLRLIVFWNKNGEKCWYSYKSLLPGFPDIQNTTCSLTLYFLLDLEMLGCSEWLNKCFLYCHYLFLLFIQIFPRFWLAKKHTHISPQPATDDQIWKNFAINRLITSKVQLSCRLMHR